MRAQWAGLAILLLCGAALADEPPTGVIVDASLLDIKRCRFPKIYDADGTMLYPPSCLFSNADYMQGFVGFMPSVAEARKQTARIGERPWIVRPEQLHKADPTGGSVDLTTEQAADLKAIEAATGVLSKDRVLIVIGITVAATSPATDAVGVPAEAAIAITLSKPLRDGQRDRMEVFLKTADSEERIDGVVSYRADTHTLVFSPAAPFLPGATYEARLPADLQAETMATLGDIYRLSFTIAKPSDASDSSAAADTKPEA